MKPRLHELLVCPCCCQAFTLTDAQVIGSGSFVEVMEGRLVCVECGRCFPIAGGVPQLVLDSVDVKKARTADSFGLLWFLQTSEATRGRAHCTKTFGVLSLPLPKGTILDAGCGDGADIATLADEAVEVV